MEKSATKPVFGPIGPCKRCGHEVFTASLVFLLSGDEIMRQKAPGITTLYGKFTHAAGDDEPMIENAFCERCGEEV